MLLSAESVLVVAQSSSEIPEGLMNNPVFGSSTYATDSHDMSVVFLCYELTNRIYKYI